MLTSGHEASNARDENPRFKRTGLTKMTGMHWIAALPFKLVDHGSRSRATARSSSAGAATHDADASEQHALPG